MLATVVCGFVESHTEFANNLGKKISGYRIKTHTGCTSTSNMAACFHGHGHHFTS